VAYLFWRGYYGEGEASPASPARGAAYPAAELMRRGEWLAGRPLRVREPFEERITGALSSLRERGSSRCPRIGFALAFIYSRGGLVTVLRSASCFSL
jgi:hypothetical protein